MRNQQAQWAYGSLTGLGITGLLVAIPKYAELWWDKEWDFFPSSSMMMQIHATLMIVFLLVLGGIIESHARIRIKHQRNRRSGLLLLVSMAALIVSGYFLYYPPTPTWYDWSIDLHTSTGLFMLVILLAHFSGKRGSKQTWDIAKKILLLPKMRNKQVGISSKQSQKMSPAR